MSPLEDAVQRAVGDLGAIGASYALVGGLAISIRTEPRFTRDVDCAVAVRDDAAAERIVSALLARGYRPAARIEQESVRRLATMRLLIPADPGVTVDLLFASSGIETEIVRDAEELGVLPGIRCKVARIGDLIALKVLARDDERRPQDRGDLAALVREASDDEIARARESVARIVQRGFARGKAGLADDLAKVIAGRGEPA